MMKLLRETWLIFAYNARRTLRSPVWLLLGVFQPVVWLLLFAPLLDDIATAPGFPPGGALTVFTPGILIMLALFGSSFVGFALIDDIRSGVLERLNVTPANRLALVLGRVLRDVAILVVQATLLLAIAWLLGLDASLAGVAITYGLVVLIGVLLACCSYALALLFKDENGLAATLNFVTQPLVLLSGIVLPLTLAPRWIRTMAEVNPFYQAVEAARSLFNGEIGAAAVLRGFLVMGVVAAVALFWAVRSFRRVVA